MKKILPDLIISCLGYENPAESSLPGVIYKSGWARDGAKGTVAFSLADSRTVADDIVASIEAGFIQTEENDVFLEYLKSKQIPIFSWGNHITIDGLEIEEGLARGKSREKCLDDKVALAQANLKDLLMS